MCVSVCVSVCVCVCERVSVSVSECQYVLQALVRSREGINGHICLKCTIIAWVNPWGVFFLLFLKISIFGSWELGPGP